MAPINPDTKTIGEGAMDANQEKEEPSEANKPASASQDVSMEMNSDMETLHTTSPSPPPQTTEPPVKDSYEDQCGDHDLPLTDQIMVMMRQETLRHLEFAWDAQRKLALLCTEDDIQLKED
jgi:hypothetical protein